MAGHDCHRDPSKPALSARSLFGFDLQTQSDETLAWMGCGHQNHRGEIALGRRHQHQNHLDGTAVEMLYQSHVDGIAGEMQYQNHVDGRAGDMHRQSRLAGIMDEMRLAHHCHLDGIRAEDRSPGAPRDYARCCRNGLSACFQDDQEFPPVLRRNLVVTRNMKTGNDGLMLSPSKESVLGRIRGCL